MLDPRFDQRGVRMSVSEDERTEFHWHDRDETGEIHDFCVLDNDRRDCRRDRRVLRLGIFLTRNGF